LRARAVKRRGGSVKPDFLRHFRRWVRGTARQGEKKKQGGRETPNSGVSMTRDVGIPD